ncbi:replication protein [Salmonella enterica]|uniref:replication protein n=1 Tax=Salmonella enterica TaxID=28901 RepID=UPI0038F6EA98
MRDYAKVSPQFWMGKSGRELRKAGPEAQVVALYLMTSPHANMLGLYYLPVLFMSHETGLPLEGALKGLKSAIEAGFCSYDEPSEMVWVHEMAAYQVGRALKPTDNQCAGVRREYAALPDNPFLSAFYERYKTDYHLNVKREIERGLEGAPEGLGSQEQEQEQEQEQDQEEKHLSGAKKKTLQTDGPIFISLPLSGGKDFFDAPESYLGELAGLYPAVNIEQEFRNMRGWLDSNPERRKTGRGIRRFITTWLQRCQDSPKSPRPSQRDINAASQPDNSIPFGFRG